MTQGCVFLGESENRFVTPDNMDSSPTKKETNKQTKNPRKDYLVMTRRAEGTQYLYQNDISVVLPY